MRTCTRCGVALGPMFFLSTTFAGGVQTIETLCSYECRDWGRAPQGARPCQWCKAPTSGPDRATCPECQYAEDYGQP